MYVQTHVYIWNSSLIQVKFSVISGMTQYSTYPWKPSIYLAEKLHSIEMYVFIRNNVHNKYIFNVIIFQYRVNCISVLIILCIFVTAHFLLIVLFSDLTVNAIELFHFVYISLNISFSEFCLQHSNAYFQ